MAHIQEFSVTGLTGRAEVYAHKLNRDINVFFGLNGSGKTSLLKIFHSALRNKSAILRNVQFREATVVIYSNKWERTFTQHFKKEPESKGGVVDDSQGPLALDDEVAQSLTFTIPRARRRDSEAGWIIKPNPKTKLGSWEHRYLPTSRLFSDLTTDSSSTVIRNERVNLTEQQLDRLFANSLVNLWTSYSTQMLTRVRLAQEVGLTNILNAVLNPTKRTPKLQLIDVDTAYATVEQFLSRQNRGGAIMGLEAFKKQYEKNDNLQRVVRDISEVEDQIRHALAPRNRLQELITKMLSNNKQVEFSDSSIKVSSADGKHVELSLLSSGEKQLFKILVETLLAGQSTIIVDEPEISMHIDWQRELLGAMTQLNSDCQIIFATHSPEVMADIDDTKIFKL